MDLNFVILPFLTGRNPIKTNSSVGKPEFTNAGTNAVGPGRVSIVIFFNTQVCTNKYPGSEIPGVPASEINATFLPSKMSCAIFSTCACSLNLWCADVFVLIL